MICWKCALSLKMLKVSEEEILEEHFSDKSKKYCHRCNLKLLEPNRFKPNEHEWFKGGRNERGSNGRKD